MDLIADAATVDGRRARRQRGRAAVMDATFDLLREGHSPPSVEAVAERAGVSVSSVFRYFDSIDDLRRQAVDHHFERFAPLFDIPELGEGGLADRVSRFVDARLAFYEAVGPIGRLARSRAGDVPPFAESLERVRTTLAGQVRAHFAAEIDALTPARGDDLVVLIDTITSFESWDLQRDTHQRSHRQIRRAWVTALTALCLRA